MDAYTLLLKTTPVYDYILYYSRDRSTTCIQYIIYQVQIVFLVMLPLEPDDGIRLGGLRVANLASISSAFLPVHLQLRGM